MTTFELREKGTAYFATETLSFGNRTQRLVPVHFASWTDAEAYLRQRGAGEERLREAQRDLILKQSADLEL
jgi:hypothetical protein